MSYQLLHYRLQNLPVSKYSLKVLICLYPKSHLNIPSVLKCDKIAIQLI